MFLAALIVGRINRYRYEINEAEEKNRHLRQENLALKKENEEIKQNKKQKKGSNES